MGCFIIISENAYSPICGENVSWGFVEGTSVHQIKHQFNIPISSALYNYQISGREINRVLIHSNI